MTAIRNIFVLLLCLLPLAISAQAEHRVTGRVTDANGEPLPFVTVVVKGTSTAVVTDEVGRYAISVSNPDVVLQFSHLGYKTVEQPITERTTVDVRMEDDVVEFNDDWVTTKVTGKIIDANTGEPIPFVTISIKGGKGGASSDIDGCYGILIPNYASEPHTLLYSSIGYKTVEQPIGRRAVIDVRMAIDSTIRFGEVWGDIRHIRSKGNIDVYGGLPYSYFGVGYSASNTIPFWNRWFHTPITRVYSLNALYRTDFSDNYVVKAELNEANTSLSKRPWDASFYGGFSRFDIPELNMNMNTYRLHLKARPDYHISTTIGTELVNFRFNRSTIDWSLQLGCNYRPELPIGSGLDIELKAGVGYWFNNPFQYQAGFTTSYKRFTADVTCGSWMGDLRVNAGIGRSFRRFDLTASYERFLNYEDVSLKLSIRIYQIFSVLK